MRYTESRWVLHITHRQLCAYPDCCNATSGFRTESCFFYLRASAELLSCCHCKPAKQLLRRNFAAQTAAVHKCHVSKCATQIYTAFLKHPANVSLSNTWFHLDMNGRANKIHSRPHFLLSPINDNGPHKRNRTRCFVFVTFCLFPHISS